PEAARETSARLRFQNDRARAESPAPHARGGHRFRSMRFPPAPLRGRMTLRLIRSILPALRFVPGCFAADRAPWWRLMADRSQLRVPSTIRQARKRAKPQPSDRYSYASLAGLFD